MARGKPFPYPGERRMATIDVSVELIAEALKLPPGSVVLGALETHGSAKYTTVRLVIEHPDFPVAQEQEVLPRALVKFEAVYSHFEVIDG